MIDRFRHWFFFKPAFLHLLLLRDRNIPENFLRVNWYLFLWPKCCLIETQARKFSPDHLCFFFLFFFSFFFYVSVGLSFSPHLHLYSLLPLPGFIYFFFLKDSWPGVDSLSTPIFGHLAFFIIVPISFVFSASLSVLRLIAFPFFFFFFCKRHTLAYYYFIEASFFFFAFFFLLHKRSPPLPRTVVQCLKSSSD